METLVAVCAGMILVVSVAQWYVSYAQMHGQAQSKVRALTVVTNFINRVQSRNLSLPRSGDYNVDGYTIHCVVRDDDKFKEFQWVCARIELPGGHNEIIELVAGASCYGDKTGRVYPD